MIPRLYSNFFYLKSLRNSKITLTRYFWHGKELLCVRECRHIVPKPQTHVRQTQEDGRSQTQDLVATNRRTREGRAGREEGAGCTFRVLAARGGGGRERGRGGGGGGDGRGREEEESVLQANGGKLERRSRHCSGLGVGVKTGGGGEYRGVAF